MGQKSTYKCSKCEYRVLTSGQHDIGMMAVTDTYSCTSCKEIVDVTVGMYGQVYSKDDIAKLDAREADRMRFNTCPECGSGDHLIKWNTTDRPCPKCNGKMNVDPEGASMMWD